MRRSRTPNGLRRSKQGPPGVSASWPTMRVMRRLAPTLVSVGFVLGTLAGCGGDESGNGEWGAGAPASATAEVAQIGGTSPTDAAQLLAAATKAADCTRIREVAPGLLGEPDACAVVASEGGFKLNDIEERLDGDVAIVEARFDDSSDQVQLLTVETHAGWLVVGGAGQDFFDEVPDLGTPGTVTDAVRAYVAAVRAEDCDAYLSAFPGGFSRGCDDMESKSVALDQVSKTAGESEAPVVTAQVTLIHDEVPQVHETRLVRTVENRWMIAAFLT
jgi:hypothetical protein